MFGITTKKDKASSKGQSGNSQINRLKFDPKALLKFNLQIICMVKLLKKKKTTFIS